MNLEEKAYVEQQVVNQSRKTNIAYLFWFFLGGFGAHRFYMGKTGSAIALLLVSLITVWFTLGIPTFIWVVIDAFLIPGWIREDQERIRQQVTTEVNFMRGK
ncbi:TM2 domain-containing protein [Staphylococcus taiwanensis]|nr:TM2 domain-containing protein [Staphylococcus taiwanensis]